MSYHGIIESGWASGIHDVRGLGYEHPWLVVDREAREVIGCWSRAEAREEWDSRKDVVV